MQTSREEAGLIYNVRMAVVSAGPAAVITDILGRRPAAIRRL
jgi:hypothetical protein